ncbi:universal stress protein [Carboxylicivirga sp. M1479]|uniref:universal stress protein n=1 Tax=Carboxylicivirga sp. M1479 TaxID=2594476 RepID=UPI0011786674|nr:universal stress protein [Carboxylicivirga sp. M1479]TRX71958.1 universal stress protein [Carboxylicivirga sp. M1479]
MKRILLLTDFSDTARNAAMYALKMFENEKVYFDLLNAYDLEFSGSPYVMQVKEELGEESLKGLKNELSLLHRRFPNARVELASRFGPLMEVVQNEVLDFKPELIVLGCRGETALENFLLGSNAYEIVKNINAAILVVPKHAKFKKPDKIVFATDLKDIKVDEVVEPLRDLSHQFQSDLMFVNVMEGDYANRIEAESKIASHFEGLSLSFNFIEGDDVCNGILKFMDDNDADMVTLVRHNETFFERLFHPSVTKKMVLHPEHPMLVLHDET